MSSPWLAAELYQYRTLAPTSAFRLLKLLKGSGPELDCELLPVSLQDGHISYEALSYTWGSNELVECIRLDRKLFWVTDNLHAALQNLRRLNEDRILWIDAICINQGDKVEQSQQVQQMGHIFEGAEKVLFWLGKATAQIIGLMDTLNNYRDSTSTRGFKRKMLKEWTREDHSIGLQQLLNREWFTRVWILQEAAKARKAEVCCGNRSLSAETFVLAPSLLKQEPPPHCKPVLDIMAESTRAASWLAQAGDLRSLLRMFKASKATDERDKIFALLGMSSGTLDFDRDIIDYQRPTSQVVHEVIIRLLEPTHSSQSEPFFVHEILDLMSYFATLDVTYFVPASGLAADAIHAHLLSGYQSIELHLPESRSAAKTLMNDPTPLLLEERPAKTLETQATCYSQVVQFMQDQQIGRASKVVHDKSMRVCSWGNEENHIKVVIVHDKKHAVMEAATRGHTHIVKHMLRMKLGADSKESLESSVLQAAVREENQEAMETLLQAGINVNAEGGEYGNALQAASLQPSKKVVEMLLKAGANVNAQGGSYGNALQAASRVGSDEKVEMLLNAGANVDAEGGFHGNALQAACFAGSDKIVKMLLKAGADVNAQGGYNGNALQASSSGARRSKKIVEMLLKAGANVNAQGGAYGNALQAASACNKNSEEIVEMLLEAGANVNAQGGGFGNALQAALFDMNKKVVAILLKAGADVNAQGGVSGKYKNALQAASASASHVSSKDIVEMLLMVGTVQSQE